ncbi:HAMP domain-containing sensor histidine kinase [Flavobacterium branchiarum]|uniref:histidine kinase n=1 Tax=Flavobacterium branchiarum TaxID=1114870 RepID=A0ABV5FSA5_9FLAO|nr:HAMP domain-containing sensor histidine kinase [Flavobacterium branchiarum]MDN3673517.1 HAMP domain-containing sensor histidine kinase [Flavobacterium branchiarum]
MHKLFLLDPKTVFLLYFWANLFICILIFSYSFSYATTDNKKTLKIFGRGKLLLTIGWTLILLRGLISDFVSINIANTLIFFACYYETIAMLSMLKTKSNRCYKLQLSITIIVVLVFNIIVLIGSTINSRILIVSLGVFAIYLPVTVCYFTEKGYNFFRTFYILCYVAFEVLIILRMIHNYLNPQKDFFVYSIFDSLYSISLFLLALIGTVGFLLLVKEKQDLKIKKLLDDRNQFFSIIAHDLRGPLGSSAGLSEILTQNIEDYSREEIKEIIEMLHESNKNTYKLLENLLDWSKVQTGMIEFSPKKIMLNTLIMENIELNKNAALNKNISLSFESSELIEVEVDKNMIDTIVRNLLTNAIKFTDKHGEITVRFEKKHQKVAISITDNGIGIPDDIKENLFKINEKVTQRGTENERGSGLGLLLCSQFIKMHQGEIWIESEPGKGSTFKFTLPLVIEKE